MNGETEDKLLELAKEKNELLNEVLLIAEEQKMFCLDNNIEVYNDFMDRRNKCVEKLKKTDVLLQRYLKHAQISAEFSGKLDALNRDSTTTIRKILAVDEVNQSNLKQAMEMIKDKKISLKTNKLGVVKYCKTASYSVAGVYTDSKG